MTELKLSMRLKVKRDTYFLPDLNGSVYFCNNLGSFRLEGEMIDQWIEKLLPMFNGEHTLHDLTEGLPEPYRNRIVEIAEVLLRNGIVRDVSRDHPHQLTDEVLKTFASQIEFLDYFGGSGAYRFQCFRQSNVLAVGSGPFLLSLVSSLFESGLPKIHVLVTDSMPTNRQRLAELTGQARKTDPQASLQEITFPKKGERVWREMVQPYDAILYVSQKDDLEELRLVHRICREEKKVLLPAVCVHQVGMAGPLVHPDSEGCWESAWRRLHRSALAIDPQIHAFSSTAGAMLANVIAFEWFKWVTGAVEPELKNKVFLLNLETLEGNWHAFLPHPLAAGHASAERIQDLDLRLEQGFGESEPGKLFAYFSMLTSAVSGIFHVWEEGDLRQLPLSQCRVQAVDPLSDGPADLLPDMVCSGLTHEEARREAGLAGIEAYVSRLACRIAETLPSLRPAEHSAATISSLRTAEHNTAPPQPFIGVGAGETVAEGVCRGLLHALTEELRTRQAHQPAVVTPVRLRAVEDERCRFYLQALTTLQGEPMIGLGADVYGFPVVWVGTGGCWFGSVGLHLTMALRKALQQALLMAQNRETDLRDPALTCPAMVASSAVLEKKEAQNLVIPAYEDEVRSQPDIVRSAMEILKRNGRRLLVFDLAVEPFLRKNLAGVFGVCLREEESR